VACEKVLHHILSLYGTGANAGFLQRAWDTNASYQRSPEPQHRPVVEQLQESWESHAKDYLAKEEHYPDFLLFFQGEIEKKGWRDVMSEFVFKGDAAADDLLVRLYSGKVSPYLASGRPFLLQ
jgi:hypothetical protein